MTTLTAARTALADAITAAVAAVAPDCTVYAYEPPTLGGTVVTVSTAGVSPTEWRLYVRVYVSTIQSQQGQDTLDDVTEAIDTDTGLAVVPRGEWSFEFDDLRGVFVMQAVMEYPRDDF
jgi:hypothetical protein